MPKEHAPPIEAHHCMATCCCSSLEPMLSVPDFVSQLWRKSGTESWVRGYCCRLMRLQSNCQTPNILVRILTFYIYSKLYILQGVRSLAASLCMIAVHIYGACHIQHVSLMYECDVLCTDSLLA